MAALLLDKFKFDFVLVYFLLDIDTTKYSKSSGSVKQLVLGHGVGEGSCRCPGLASCF